MSTYTLPTPALQLPRAGKGSGEAPRPGPAALGRAGNGGEQSPLGTGKTRGEQSPLGTGGSGARWVRMGAEPFWVRMGAQLFWVRMGAQPGAHAPAARPEPPEAAAAQNPRSSAPVARSWSCSRPAAAAGPVGSGPACPFEGL